MAVHDNREFDQLFAAYSNRELTAEERSRLLGLASQDVGRRGGLAELDAVHELLDLELVTRQRIQRPAEPSEEADESYQRLVVVAARAETRLRATLEQAPVLESLVVKRPPQARVSMRVWGLALAAAVIAVISLVFALNGDTPPSLDQGNPDHRVLGGSDIAVTTAVSASSPRLSWAAHAAAVRYSAAIVDVAGVVVLERPATELRQRRATNWDLSAADLEVLARQELLFLRVIAFDKQGVEVARTQRDKPLQVR